MAMADSSFSTTDIIDKRILREEYRGYDLVARFWEYGYLGKIWFNRRPVEEIDASDNQTLDDLIRQMRAMVDGLIAEKSRARKNRPPSQAEVNDTFRAVADKFTPLEKLLLKTHAEEEGGVSTMGNLQRLLNFTSADSVLELYGRIGQKVNDHIGYQPKPSRTLNPHLKYVVDISGKGSEQVLRLPESIQLFVHGQSW